MHRKLTTAVTLLAGALVGQAAENYIILKPGPEGIDKYCGSYYNQQGVDSDILRVGGWGDYYQTLLKFDGVTQNVPGTFKRAELWLYHFNTTRPTDMKTWILTTRWSEAPNDHQNLMGYYIGDYPKPDLGTGWYGINVTSSVNYWRQNPSAGNYGWCFSPAANDNRFDEFYSSDSTSASLRPELRLVYDVPDFKMPLPGGKAWKLTVEAGGKANDGADDPYHINNTYYSLDFAPWSVQASGIGPLYNETDVPVLAMAGGYVYGVGNDPAVDPYTGNGYYVKIDHDGDGDPKTGIQSVYCHLKLPPSVNLYQTVYTGQKLGTMGKTGIYNTGIHIHVTFYCKGTAIGNGNDPLLDQIAIEGRAIKNYKLNFSNRATPIFYPSSNVMR